MYPRLSLLAGTFWDASPLLDHVRFSKLDLQHESFFFSLDMIKYELFILSMIWIIMNNSQLYLSSMRRGLVLVIKNESKIMDYMGKTSAIKQCPDHDKNFCIMSQALGWDFARRGCGREVGLQRATLEDLGEIFASGKRGCSSIFAHRIGRWEAWKGNTLSLI